MTRKQNILHGHGHGLPPVTAAAKASHHFLTVGVCTRLRRNHMRDRLAMPGNRHGLAALNIPQEFRQMRLGFGCLHGSHRP